MGNDITHAYVGKVEEMLFHREKAEGMAEISGFAAKALEFAASEAAMKTQPTEAAIGKAKALNACTAQIGAVEFVSGYTDEIAGIIGRAKAIAALDPEGLSGDEMRKEICRIATAGLDELVETLKSERLAA